MNLFLSYKLKILSFFSMILVVLLHANLIDYSYGLSKSIQIFITSSITRIAVPLFFIISGFLFFIEKKIDITFWKHQYIKRCKTLVLPYVIWSCIGWFLIYVSSNFELSFSDISLNPPRTLYQLWFLRDLIVCIIIAPFIYVFLYYLDVLALLLLYLLVKYCYVIEGSSIFDFALGAYLATNKFSFIKNEKSNKIVTFFCGLIWVLGCYFQIKFNLTHIFYLVHLNILLGIFFIWNLYNILYKKILIKITKYKILSTSFFIYLFHEPLLSILKKTALYSNNQFIEGTFAIYILSFLFSIILCICVACIINRYLPQLYNVLTGGRNF